MRQKFSIAKILLATAAAILFAGAGPARAADVEVKSGVPDRYTVQKGDTLWGIAGKFLKDPWRWPDIWRLNREQIRNPHLIYPGDVIVLDRVDGQWRLSLDRPTTRLSPTVRVTPLDAEAIPSIPAGDLEPFLSRPIITGPAGLDTQAQIIAGRDTRVIRGEGDVVYVLGLDPKAGDLWNIYRRGREFTPLNSNELLGVEQRYLGTAKVERFAEVSTLRIVAANEEILVGDQLIPAPRGQLMSYAPHAPGRPIDGQIIALNRGATEAGRGWIVTLDRGAQRRARRRSGARHLSRRRADCGPAPAHLTRSDRPGNRCDPILPAGPLRPGARRAQRSPLRLPRLRPRLVRDPAQHHRTGCRRRLRPKPVAVTLRRR